jgi:UDP-N-acetylmuramoyl-tripeptide--D-alanyl-D-alanine ligase
MRLPYFLNNCTQEGKYLPEGERRPEKALSSPGKGPLTGCRNAAYYRAVDKVVFQATLWQEAMGLAEKKQKVTVKKSRTIRAFILKRRIPVVAVTGTSGKTTTKEMIASILRRRRGRVLKTFGNANKREHTARLLRRHLNRRVRGLVIEMGMDGRGQIAAHCRLVRPNIGVITNVNRAHVGKCGGFLGVVKAKNELVYGVRRRGVLILNADDPGTRLLKLGGFKGRILWFGRSSRAHYRLLDSVRERGGFRFIVWAEGREHRFYVRSLGEHDVYNALAAIAAARVLHIPWSYIHRGLISYYRAEGRLKLYRGIGGSSVIDDSYNANPLSVTAGLQALVQVAADGHSVAVLGRMGEQGRYSARVHFLVGQAAARLGVDELVTVGQRAKSIALGAAQAGMPPEQIHSFLTLGSAFAFLRRNLDQETVVLVKGSHATRIFRVARALAGRRV